MSVTSPFSAAVFVGAIVGDLVIIVGLNVGVTDGVMVAGGFVGEKAGVKVGALESVDASNFCPASQCPITLHAKYAVSVMV